jgi:hypothetical protein
MGKVIVVSIVILIIALVMMILIYRAHKRATTAPEMGDLGLKQEQRMRQLLSDACRVMAGLGAGANIDDSDVISSRSRAAIDKWSRQYHSYLQRETNA